jgi:hypothetical protein
MVVCKTVYIMIQFKRKQINDGSIIVINIHMAYVLELSPLLYGEFHIVG